MLSRFRKYIESAPTNNLSEVPDEWFDVYHKLLTCHKNESKCRMLLSQMMETSLRLCDVQCKPCKSIKIDADVLYFSMSDIPTDDILCEQKACMQMIHQYAMSRQHASVVFDFSKFSSKSFFQLARKATPHNIIDGYRMWSTIPCNIQEITVIRSNSIIWDTIFHFGSSFITDKLKQRITIKK